MGPKGLTLRLIFQTTTNFNRTTSLRRAVEAIEANSTENTNNSTSADSNTISEKTAEDWESYFQITQLQKMLRIVPKNISE